MLLEFGFKNFFSFKEGVSISFRLDANCPEKISGGRSYTPVLGINGANASGKTQILKALSFLGTFCSKSFATDPDSSITISPFFESQESTDFYVEFSRENVIYVYELTVTPEEVVREVIYQKKAKKTKIFERALNEITYVTSRFSALRGVKLRKNASIISIARQYELIELSEMHQFFNTIVGNVSFGGLRENPVDINAVSKFLHKSVEDLNFVKDFISECDVGVKDLKIIQTTAEDGGEKFIPIFYHENNGKLFPVTSHTESSGTKSLFRNLPLYRIILRTGGVLIVDEFDVHLHPQILPKLIALFLDEDVNKNGAQFLFTTHDGEVLDLLGRYRAYVVTKRENESFAVRLDEIPGDILRNDRPIFPVYRDGKIGGVPRI